MVAFVDSLAPWTATSAASWASCWASCEVWFAYRPPFFCYALFAPCFAFFCFALEFAAEITLTSPSPLPAASWSAVALRIAPCS